MSPELFGGFCRGGGAVAFGDGDWVASGVSTGGLSPSDANRWDSSRVSNSQATITASPISSTRQFGRPLPLPSSSDRSAVLGATACGSRSRATTAIATSASVTLSTATTIINAARLPPSSACELSGDGRYPRRAAATTINSTIRATTRPVGLSVTGRPIWALRASAPHSRRLAALARRGLVGRSASGHGPWTGGLSRGGGHRDVRRTGAVRQMCLMCAS